MTSTTYKAGDRVRRINPPRVGEALTFVRYGHASNPTGVSRMTMLTALERRRVIRYTTTPMQWRITVYSDGQAQFYNEWQSEELADVDADRWRTMYKRANITVFVKKEKL